MCLNVKFISSLSLEEGLSDEVERADVFFECHDIVPDESGNNITAVSSENSL